MDSKLWTVVIVLDLDQKVLFLIEFFIINLSDTIRCVSYSQIDPSVTQGDRLIYRICSWPVNYKF